MNARRTLLLPLVPIYGAVVQWKRRMFAEGWLRKRTLRDVVISVGSVSAGGAGKTPVVLLLADVLGRRGYAVRILTRGYGRGRSEVERVDPAGDADRYGDEPVLLARRSGVPVYVGADRYRAGRMAEETPSKGAVVYLLDDGFQHQRLRRDLDVVLLTRKDVEDGLLPAGHLREPLSALRAAEVVVLREDEAESLQGVVAGLARETGMPRVWVIRRRLKLPISAFGPLPERPIAFCGIARPESFFGMLAEEGVRATTTVAFGDHHRYSERHIERLVKRAAQEGADGWVTTEKDAVKLTREMRSRLAAVGPMVVPELGVELVNERAVMEQMVAMVSRLNRRKGRP